MIWWLILLIVIAIGVMDFYADRKAGENPKLKLKLNIICYLLFVVLFIIGAPKVIGLLAEKESQVSEQKAEVFESIASELEADQEKLIITVEDRYYDVEESISLYNAYYDDKSYIFKMKGTEVIHYSEM